MSAIQTKNVVLSSTAAKPGLSTWYATHMEDRTIGDVKPNEIVLKVNAVGFNHRDKWIRQGLYPEIEEGKTMGSDAAGVVVADGEGDKSELIGKRFFLNPSRGWCVRLYHLHSYSHNTGSQTRSTAKTGSLFLAAARMPKERSLPLSKSTSSMLSQRPTT